MDCCEEELDGTGDEEDFVVETALPKASSVDASKTFCSSLSGLRLSHFRAGKIMEEYYCVASSPTAK